MRRSKGHRRPFFRRASSALRLGLLLAAVAGLTYGCKSAEDRDIDAKLSTVATHRSAHPHYPVTVIDDFGVDSEPSGMAVDAYGFYVHESSKSKLGSSELSSALASQMLEKTFERALQSVRTAESTTPPPKAPYPVSPDWKAAPHPTLGTYTLIARCGPEPRSFNISFDPKATDTAQALTELKPELLRDAQLVVADGLKSQNTALKTLAPVGGFSLVTDELLKVVQGSRGVEPHLIGGPLLLTPIDTALARKALEHSIQRLLANTLKIQPRPSTAHLIVNGPGFDETYTISLDEGDSEKKDVKAALDGLSARLDDLNKK